jgi:hypothetical protein
MLALEACHARDQTRNRMTSGSSSSRFSGAVAVVVVGKRRVPLAHFPASAPPAATPGATPAVFAGVLLEVSGGMALHR